MRPPQPAPPWHVRPPQPAQLGGLHVLADDDPRWPRDPCAQAAAACDGGASVVQLRCKHATDAAALDWGREIRRITADSGTLFFVNDRWDLALALDADGVHLGQDDVPPGRLPADARAALRIGRSTHDLAQARAVQREGVDYVAIGPVFGTSSKESPWAPPGVDGVARAAALVAPLPLIAIGGVDCEGAERVARAGAAGAAVISAVAAAADPVAATRDLVAALAAGTARRERGAPA